MDEVAPVGPAHGPGVSGDRAAGDAAPAATEVVAMLSTKVVEVTDTRRVAVDDALSHGEAIEQLAIRLDNVGGAILEWLKVVAPWANSAVSDEEDEALAQLMHELYEMCEVSQDVSNRVAKEG